MVSLSFSSFMLVMLLFIFLTIKDTIAHTDDQAKQIVHDAEIDNIRDLRSHLRVKKEVLDGVPAAAEFSNGKTGGRKMMIERKKDMKEVKRAESSGAASASVHSVGNLKYHKGQGKLREMSGISSKSHSMKANTGRNYNSPSNRPLGDSRKNVHHQGDERENSMINPASRFNSKNSSTKLVSTDDQFDDNGSFQKLESEKLVDDSTEFFTMMNKDYVGVKQMVHEAENDNARTLSHLSVDKEVLDGVPAAAEFSNRKMMIERKKDMMEETTIVILVMTHERTVHHQGNERDSMNSASTDNSKNDDQSDDNGSFENLESENFQDDATEFFTMNRDYVGRPRRKP
ncbi:hypothetical protein H5410_018237, partial [Solanum commersonii]